MALNLQFSKIQVLTMTLNALDFVSIHNITGFNLDEYIVFA